MKIELKIEFIKETKGDGEALYFTNVNNKFIDKSLSYSKEKAYVIYQHIINNKGKNVGTEILESVIIEDDIVEL